MPNSAFDELRKSPYGNELDTSPTDFRLPSELASNQDFLTGASLTPEIPTSQQAHVNRFRAEDLSQRGIPSYLDAHGDVTAIKDETGASLTGFDARHGIAYDKAGQPKHITYDETGPPVLKDAFSELHARTDPTTGYIEKKGMGLYQFVGQDPVIAAANLQKEKDKTIKNEAALIGRKLSLDEHDLIAGTKEHTALKKDLQETVPTLLDPKYKEADQATILKAIDEHFNAEYATPEANASRGFFGGGLSPEAQTLRQGIDERKAKAIEKATQFFGLQDSLNTLGDSVAAGKDEQRTRIETLLAHSRGEKGPLDQPASNEAATNLYPPEEDQARMLGGQPLEPDRVVEHAGTGNIPASAVPASIAVSHDVADAQKTAAALEKTNPTLAAQFKNVAANMLSGLATGVGDILRSSTVKPGLEALINPFHAAGVVATAATSKIFGVPQDTIRQLVNGAVDEVLDKPTKALLDDRLSGTFGAKAGNFIGGIAPFVATALATRGKSVATPLMATLFYNSGFQRTYDDALAHGASEEKAQGAATAVGAINAVLALPLKTVGAAAEAIFGDTAPKVIERAIQNAYDHGGPEAVGGLLGKLAESIRAGGKGSEALRKEAVDGIQKVMEEIRKPVGQRVADVAKAVATNAAIGAGVQTASNLVSKTYDPSRGTFEGVPEQAIGFGALAGLSKGFEQVAAARKAKQALDLLAKKEPPASPGLPSTPGPTKPKPGGPSEIIHDTGQPLQETGKVSAEKPVAGRTGVPGGQAGQGTGNASKNAENAPAPANLLTIQAAEKAFVEQGGHADKLDAQQKLTALREAFPDPAARIKAIEERLSIPSTSDEAAKVNIDQAAHEAATSPKNGLAEPTQAQKEAGNYQKGHVTVGGLDVSIENPAGSKRQPEFAPLKSHYGYVKGTVGADKDHVDVFIKPGTPAGYSGPVYVVNQYDKTGKFDEHKGVIGVSSTAEAMAEYKANYEKGWTGGKSVVEFANPAAFKTWATTGTKGQPATESLAKQEKPLKPSTGEQKGAVTQGEPQTAPAKQGHPGLVEPRPSEPGRLPGKPSAPARIQTVEEARASVERAKTEHADEAKALGVNYVEGTFGRSGFKTEVDGSSIGIDHEAVAKGAANVESHGGDGHRWISDSIHEENAHIRDIVASRGQDFDGLHRHFWGELSEDAQAAVRQFYPDTQKAVNFAGEYIRMVWQYRKLGHITERNFLNTETIEPFLAEPQSDALEAHLKRMGALTETKTAKSETIAPQSESRVPLLEKPTKTQRRANALTERLNALEGVKQTDVAVIKTLLGSSAKIALDQAESRIAKLENQHATTTGEKQGGAGAELPRVPPRPDVSTHEGKIREEAGGQAGGGGGAIERPPASAEQPVVRQSQTAPEIDAATKASLDSAFEGLFAGIPRNLTEKLQGNEQISEGDLEQLKKSNIERLKVPAAERAPVTLTEILAHLSKRNEPFGAATPKRGDRDYALRLLEGVLDNKFPGWRQTPKEKLAPQAQRLLEQLMKVYQRATPDSFGAGSPLVQLAIPSDKIGGFVKAAQELVRQNVDTPEKLGALLEKLYGGKARPFSQALWDMLGTVKPALRGTHDWAAIYLPKASSDAGLKPQNAEQLSRAVYHQILHGPLDRRALTELASETGLDAKRIDEAAEIGIVVAARSIAQGDGTAEQKFDELVELYDRQPNLTAKTSTSKVNQAYSTPAPLAFAASYMADISGGKRIYEPTAGNGMLLIEADVTQAVVNELDTARATALKLMGFNPHVEDATKFAPTGIVDRVIANPPFGTVVTEDQETKEWPLTGTDETTREIDHAISLKALSAMQDDGRATLILGGKNKLLTGDARAEAYNRGDGAKFWKALYSQYQVVDHFTLNGDLYTKQGAGWPIDVVVIAGRGKSPIQLPSADGPRILDSWDDLRAELGRTDADRIDAGRYNAERDRERLGGIIGSIRGIAGAEQVARPERDLERLTAEHGGAASGLRAPSGDQGQQPALGGGSGTGEISPAGGEGQLGTGTTPGEPVQRGQLGEFRVPYKPASKLKSFGIFVPTNMEAPAREALAALEQKVGPVDDFVLTKLGYKKDAPLERYFSAEQIDAIALGISAIDDKTAFVLGDQGGVGKGRVAAGMIRYAIKQGKLPIFVTNDEKLYAAMIEDLHDIGSDDIEPIFTNNWVAFEDFAGRKWKQDSMTKVMKEIAATGKLPAGADVLFTTYSQIQTDVPPGFNASKTERYAMKAKHQPPPDGPRMLALKKLAPGAIIIADESHLASGDSIRAWRLAPLLAQAHGVYYSSATFAKRPDSMGIYSRTSLSHATNSMDDLVDAMRQGGVPLQQVVSATLAADGLYLRRERDFSKAVFRTHLNLDTQERDTRLADNYTEGLRMILGISNKMKEAKDQINKILRREGKSLHIKNAPRIETTNFASKLHNLVSQYMLAIKSEATVRRTVEGVTKGFPNKEGEVKPHRVIIALTNTMEAPILDLERSHRPLTFNGMLLKYLDSQRILTSGSGKNAQTTTISNEPDPNFVKYTDRDLERLILANVVTDEGGETTAKVNEPALAELFRRIMVGVFKEVELKLEAIDLADMPLSPIDHMRRELEKAGIKVAEITKRGIGIDEDGNTYKVNPSTNSKAAHLRYISDFNNGDTQVLILNASGSTGISMHASEKFKNQDPRAMILVQPNLDINQFVQTMYRTDRTGQVHQPYYELLQTAIPAELRPAAILSRKMGSLNANTTSNAENEISVGNKGVDIFNQYGDETVFNYLKSDHVLTEMLQMVKIMDGETLMPFSDIQALYEQDGQFAAAVTGRLAILPTSEQEAFWTKVVSDYVAFIAYLNELGENELAATAIDLKAETLESKELTPATPSQGRPSGFDAVSTLEKIRADIGLKPLPATEVVKMMDELGSNAYELKQEWQAKVDAWKQKMRARLKESLLGWSEEQQKGYESKWREQEEEISAALDLIGSGLHIKTEKGMDGYGAITSVHFDELRPDLPSKQIFTVHVNTTKKTLRIPASQLPSIARLAVGDFADLYEATAERSNQRYMVTGNLLAAYLAIRDSAPTAKIVQYTTDKGELRQGILMPAKFTPGALTKKRVVESARHMLELLLAGRTLTSAGDVIRMFKWQDALTIAIPGSRVMGGGFWRDPQLAKLMEGGEFVQKSSGVMLGRFSLDNSHLVYQRLLDLDATLFFTEQEASGEAFGAARPVRAAVAFKDSVTNAAKEAGLTFKESLRMTQHLVSPTTGVAMDAHDQVMRMQGERNQKAYETDRVLEAARQSFDGMTRPEQIAFIDKMKQGEAQPTPELQAVADTMRKIDTESWDAAVAAYVALGFKDKEVPLKWLENHYRVLWKKIPGSNDVERSEWIGRSRRGLRGSMGQHKQHTLETMSDGLDLGGIPYSYNPVNMFKLAQVDLWKLTTTLKTWKWAKDNGFVEFVRGPFPKAPDGMVQLDDSIANVYFPADSGEGLIHAGKYFVEEGFGRLLNNYLSQDYIRQVKIGRGLLWIKNATTSLELSLSAFHGMFETAEAVGSSIGHGLHKLVNRGILKGNLSAAASGLKDMTIGAVAAPVTGFNLGRDIRKAAADPEAYFKTADGKKMLQAYPRAREMIDDLFVGGWKPNELEQDWKNNSIRTFVDSVADIKAGASDNYVGAVLRAFPAANEFMMKPLFDYYIPNLKLAQFFKEYAEAIEQNERKLKGGILTRAALARQTWRFVEDRFGEMNFDTLFWNRNFKTAMQLMFRSVTWKLGSVEAFAGAFSGQGKEFRDAFREKRAPELHRNTAWILGMFLLTATLGYIMSKVLAGKEPKDLKDYVFPQIDPKDDKVRVSLPTYFKDLVHLIHAPGNYIVASMAGWIGRVADLLRNRDYYGVQIRDSDDPVTKQALAVGKYTAQSLLPFSIRGYKNLSAQDVNTARKLLSVLGINPAPRYIGQSAAERRSEEYWRGTQTEAGIKPAQFETKMEKRRLVAKLRHGESIDISGALASGAIKPGEVKPLYQRAQMGALASGVNHMPLAEAERVYKLASAQERVQLAPIMARKRINAAKKGKRMFQGF